MKHGITDNGGFRTKPSFLALEADVRHASAELLNQILAETLLMADLYKKCHWQVRGPTFRELHKLFEKHYEQQAELADHLAERVQLLGGTSVAMPHDVAERSEIERPPFAAEPPVEQLWRLLRGHEHVLRLCRAAARQAGEADDVATEDLLISELIRTNEMQVWFLEAHLSEVPLTVSARAPSAEAGAEAEGQAPGPEVPRH